MRETNSVSISGLLAHARDDKEMSLEQAAEKLNLSAEQLSVFEKPNLDVSELTAFERGYLRNYAALLEVDLQQFPEFLPAGNNLTSELHPTAEYNDYSQKPPFFGASLFKKIFWSLLLFLIGYGVYSVWPGGAELSEIAEDSFELRLEIPDLIESENEPSTLINGDSSK